MSESLFTQPLVGYRSWVIKDDQLLPIARSGPWQRQMMAHCHRLHDAPSADCECGLYALYQHSQIEVRGDKHLIGAVIARGDVMLHPFGFRAQQARIVGLLRPDGGWRLRRRAKKIATAYQVPLVNTRHQLQQLACSYGQELSVQHRPAPLAVSDWEVEDDGQFTFGSDAHRVQFAERVQLLMFTLAFLLICCAGVFALTIPLTAIVLPALTSEVALLSALSAASLLVTLLILSVFSYLYEQKGLF